MSSAIIPLKISQLALLISQRKHIPINAALGYIYDSPFYKQLYMIFELYIRNRKERKS